MIIVRVSGEKVRDGRYRIESYHMHGEKLSAEQRQGSVQVDSIPEALSDDRYWRTLVMNGDGSVGVYEERKRDSGKTVLLRLIKEGRMSVDEVEDEELRRELKEEL